jgi:hypothetical protein
VCVRVVSVYIVLCKNSKKTTPSKNYVVRFQINEVTVDSLNVKVTTGIGRLHSAKALPSVSNRKKPEKIRKKFSGIFCRALGKSRHFSRKICGYAAGRI